MKTVLGLLVLLAASTHGLDYMCDATQNATCYGALGGPVYLQLMRNARRHELSLYYDGAAVFIFRKSKSVFYNEFNTTSVLQRWQFVPDNGTMIINSTERRDTRAYIVKITEESTGKGVNPYTVQLIIEAPVSDVDLSITCSANGERSIKCSSNGDSPQYSWSLDGRPLGEADADLSSDDQTLLLRGNVTGQLTCSVSNHVSSTHTTRLMELCSESPANRTLPSAPTESPASGTTVMYVSCFLVLILVCLCVAVWIFYSWRKRRNTHTPVKPEDPDDVVYIEVTSNARGRRSEMHGMEAQDVVYSDVAMANRRSRRKSRKPPAAEAYELEYAEVSAYKRQAPAHTHTPAEAVEYGEVRLHTHTHRRADTHTPAQQDNSVYAHVRQGQ